MLFVETEFPYAHFIKCALGLFKAKAERIYEVDARNAHFINCAFSLFKAKAEGVYEVDARDAQFIKCALERVPDLAVFRGVFAPHSL